MSVRLRNPVPDLLDDTDDDPWATTTTVSFTSAVRTADTSPAKRRRGSDAPARGRTDHDPWTDIHHSRARTIDSAGVNGRSNSKGGRQGAVHPLSSMGNLASTSSYTLDHDSRPGMRRMLSEGESGGRRANGDIVTKDNAPVHANGVVEDPEKLVFVHEISPADSLAGVALKYGVTVAELRRANQLWSSDSIHLRNVLYIPVEKSRQAKHIVTKLVDDTIPVSDAPTMRRVPASKLSFFPPPSSCPPPPAFSALGPAFAPSHQTMPSRRNGAAPQRAPFPTGFTRSGPLDILSSTVETLAARLSLDSSGTPPNSNSTTSDDLEWEHELDDVSPAASRARTRHARVATSPGPGADRRRKTAPDAGGLELDHLGIFGSPTPTHRKSTTWGRASTPPPATRAAPYSSPARAGPLADSPARIQTAQLQPSPEMQLPLRNRPSVAAKLRDA